MIIKVLKVEVTGLIIKGLDNQTRKILIVTDNQGFHHTPRTSIIKGFTTPPGLPLETDRSKKNRGNFKKGQKNRGNFFLNSFRVHERKVKRDGGSVTQKGGEKKSSTPIVSDRTTDNGGSDTNTKTTTRYVEYSI